MLGRLTARKSILYYLILIILSVVMVFPLIWMFLSSLKTTEEIFAVPLEWLPKIPQWGNFSGALELAPFG